MRSGSSVSGRLAEDIPTYLLRFRLRALTGERYSLIDFCFYSLMNLLDHPGVNAAIFELATRDSQWITSAPGFNFCLRPVRLGVAEHVSGQTVGHRFDDRRTLPCSGAGDGLCGRTVHLFHIVTINDNSWDITSASSVSHSFDAGLFANVGHLRI